MKFQDRVRMYELEGIANAEALAIARRERVTDFLKYAEKHSNSDSVHKALIQAITLLNLHD